MTPFDAFASFLGLKAPFIAIVWIYNNCILQNPLFLTEESHRNNMRVNKG